MDHQPPEIRVLVTGGSGYVGSVLVPYLARTYPVRVLETMAFGNPIADTPNVEFIKGDIRDAGIVKIALQDITHVVHLAGIVTDELCDMNPSLARAINEEATQQLCQLAKEAGIQRLIYASSSSVYGTQDEECTEETVPKPMTVYAETKLQAEKICLTYAGEKMCVAVLRSATCMGPAPRMRLDTIVNTFSKQAFYDRQITVWDGKQYRSNIHIQDVAFLYANLLAANAEKVNGQWFNGVFSSRRALTIAKIVKTEADWWWTDKIPIVVDETKEDKRHYRMASILTRSILGWNPLMGRSIAEAVSDNFTWFAQGKISDPDSDLYVNTKRMASFMKVPQGPVKGEK